jgi:hypothetical protein
MAASTWPAEPNLPTLDTTMQHDVEKLITDAGGTIESGGLLPDGSGFMTASFPLPTDHWLTKPGFDVPPMPFRVGTENPRHREIVQKIHEAGKYALRGATMKGADMDLDPDALLQNLVVGLIGYHTPDGTSSLCGDPHDNPSPLPPLAFV